MDKVSCLTEYRMMDGLVKIVECPRIISRITLRWLLALFLLGGAMEWRTHYEVARCKEYETQHAYKSPGRSPALSSDGQTVSLGDLCQPGEFEPWWAKLIILGAFGALIGTIFLFTQDAWRWIHRTRKAV